MIVTTGNTIGNTIGNTTTFTIPICAECTSNIVHSLTEDGYPIPHYESLSTDNCPLCIVCCMDEFQEFQQNTCYTCNRNIENLKTVTANKSIVTEDTKDVKWYCNDDCKEADN